MRSGRQPLIEHTRRAASTLNAAALTASGHKFVAVHWEGNVFATQFVVAFVVVVR